MLAEVAGRLEIPAVIPDAPDLDDSLPHDGERLVVGARVALHRRPVRIPLNPLLGKAPRPRDQAAVWITVRGFAEIAARVISVGSHCGSHSLQCGKTPLSVE